MPIFSASVSVGSRARAVTELPGFDPVVATGFHDLGEAIPRLDGKKYETSNWFLTSDVHGESFSSCLAPLKGAISAIAIAQTSDDVTATLRIAVEGEYSTLDFVDVSSADLSFISRAGLELELDAYLPHEHSGQSGTRAPIVGIFDGHSLAGDLAVQLDVASKRDASAGLVELSRYAEHLETPDIRDGIVYPISTSLQRELKSAARPRATVLVGINAANQGFQAFVAPSELRLLARSVGLLTFAIYPQCWMV